MCDASGNTPLAGDFLQIIFAVSYPKQCGNAIESICATQFLDKITIAIRGLTAFKATIQINGSAPFSVQLASCSITSKIIKPITTMISVLPRVLSHSLFATTPCVPNSCNLNSGSGTDCTGSLGAGPFSG
ncbi:unnamed protein product [Adineta steineri]|uniref:Uncharacterized protein n=1 Tax=Adineta steineri TaxID=433720 RepID=A0A815QXU2_9BILA|nr:unnamed protein product [Adineta steineri]CAF1468729.1 unnamed protein product [Adineta steineri]CAF1469264.1 unnamed protein product [Adineta steineri]